MNEEPIKSGAIFRLEGLMNFFLRVLAIVFIVISVRYWMFLVGVADPEIRFDTMPVHWKLAAATLSVCYPVVALGLWGMFRWGIVVWFLTASVELVMYLAYPHLFGDYFAIVIFHVASMSAWLIYALIQFLDSKRGHLTAH